jgi:CheY-like chemotaxis protein/HPt (histidine-containing phosphotransfer) domain-containing protein
VADNQTTAPDALQKMLLQLRNTFLEDMPEKFDLLENLLLEIEKNGADSEVFNESYRIVHSLKGSGGTHGLHIITTICHQLEDLLNTTDGGAKFTPKHISISLKYVDLLRLATERIHAGDENFPLIEKRLGELRQKLAPEHFSVLLVDNSKLLTNICLQALSGLPVHTVVMHDGLQALTRVLSEHFDLLVTSNEVPRLNGFALIAAIRLSDSQNRHVKAIIISSNKKHATSLNRTTDPDYVIIKDAKLTKNIVEITMRALSTTESA